MTTSHLSADWLTAWRRGITAKIDETLALFETIHDYPPGENAVLAADDQSRAAAARLTDTIELPAALVAFYSAIAELQLPDIDYGYFIHPPDLVLDHYTDCGPVHFANHGTGIVFGSDGGGILFALDRDGRVHRSTTASWLDDFEVAAPALLQFLKQLHRAVADFTDNTKRPSQPC